MIPRWLAPESGSGACPPSKAGSRRKGFLDKTLAEITTFFRDGLFSEEFSGKDGVLQGIDPRVKILTVLLFVVTVSFLRHLPLIAALYLVVVVLSHFSRIPLRFFLVRVWLFIPLFSGIIALPALFNVIVPGDPLLVLLKFDGPWSLGPIKMPATLSVTRQGITVASTFVLRVAVSVSWVILLLLTTRWSHLLKALDVLWIPQMFTFIIGMTYRYIHLLLRLAQDIHLARKSRLIRKSGLRSGQAWVASQMGVLLRKSMSISEEVHAAMLSRGYTRDIKILDTLRLRKADYWWTGFSILGSALALWLNRP